MSLSRRQLAAYIALAAMLFSALSPAMASVLFSDRPEILARVLGAPAKPMASGAHADICQHEAAGAAQHSNGEHLSSDGTGHAAHGIFCLFCLAASSMVTVPGVTNGPTVLIDSAAVFVPTGRVQPVATRLLSTHRSRAPPVFS